MAGFVAIALGCPLSFHLLSGALEKRARASAPGSPEELKWVLLRRLAVALVLGVIPALFLAARLEHWTERAGLAGRPGLAATEVNLGLIAIALGAMWFASRNPKVQAQYPELRAAQWGAGLWTVNCLTWGAHLLGYEFFFRGFLLLALRAVVPTPWAIAVSAGLYVASHASRPVNEIAGSVVMAPVFIGLALADGTIWNAVALHLAIALGMEGACVIRARSSATQKRRVWQEATAGRDGAELQRTGADDRRAVGGEFDGDGLSAKH
jgi:membrane protease YdiL (CAAX protease family)